MQAQNSKRGPIACRPRTAIHFALLVTAAMMNAGRLTADDSLPSSEPTRRIEPAMGPIEPSIKASEPEGVNWGGVLKHSMSFLALQHSFRLLTEAGTRDGLNQIPRGYVNSISNLHGWSDGDEFYVNYVGHSMQGATAGFIWAQNDRQFRTVEFGRNRRYWKSRMRATAFSLAYSTQFEIGPISEASLGQIQAHHPQQGLVDHVVTPAIGLGWMLAEDAMDKYVIKYLEKRVTNRYGRALLRGGLNPTRSLANFLGGRKPWARDNRQEFLTEPEADYLRRRGPTETRESTEAPPGVAPFEFSMSSSFRTFMGPAASDSCLGGGASGAFRIAPAWQLVADVNGCSLHGLAPNTSGDSISFLVGPRWAPMASGRWNPYIQMMSGVQKVTLEENFPAKRIALERIAQQKHLPAPSRADYTREAATSGLSLAAGAGVDLKLNAAIALRLASLDYTHSHVSALGGNHYRSELRFTSGLVLRFGTW
jgi:hypothetical protein